LGKIQSNLVPDKTDLAGEQPRRTLRQHLSSPPGQAPRPLPPDSPSPAGHRRAGARQHRAVSLGRPVPLPAPPAPARAPHGRSGYLLALGSAGARPWRDAPLTQGFQQAEPQLWSRAGCWSRCPARGPGLFTLNPALLSQPVAKGLCFSRYKNLGHCGGSSAKGNEDDEGWEHLLCEDKLGELGPFSPEKAQLRGPYQGVPDGDGNDGRARA